MEDYFPGKCILRVGSRGGGGGGGEGLWGLKPPFKLERLINLLAIFKNINVSLVLLCKLAL